MNNKSISKEESLEKMNENQDFIKFLENGIKAGNPEVINNIPLSALRNACTISQPSNQENEMNPERPMVFQGPDLNSKISNDQQIFNNFQSHTSPEYETGKSGQFPFDDREVSNIGDSITRGINGPKLYQTMNSSHVFGFNYVNTQTSQDLLKNSESGNKTPFIDLLSTLKNNTVPSDLNMANKDYACNRKGIASNYEALNYNSQGLKRSEDEFLTKSGQYFANLSKEGGMNYDFSWKKSATNQMAFEHNQMCIDNAFQTIKETPSLNQGMQILDDVSKNAIFTVGQTIASNNNISEIAQNDHEPSKISDSVTSNCSRENMLPVPGRSSYHRNVNNPYVCTDYAFQTIKESPSLNQGMQVLDDVGKNALFTVGQTIASNTSISEIAQNEHEPSKISDSMTSNCSREKMLAVPVSTGFHFNENNSNLLGDTLQPLHKAEKGKVLTCNVCKAKIANHKHTYVENILYECCICNYNDSEPNNLHQHSCTPLPYKFCNICLKEHTEGDSHDGAQTCTVPECNKTVDCRTQLKEHLLDHKDYFERHCWECCKSSVEHRNKDEGKTFYTCCLCDYKMRDKLKWLRHKNTHCPKFFCKLCKEEYPAEEKGSHQNEFTCIVCKRSFKCKGLFEQDSIDHEDYFYFQCRVCDKKISDHEVSDQSYIFKCCFCPQSVKQKCELRSHLYKHFDFKVYKCDTCGGRFKHRKDLDKHSESCPAVPYKCESCPARFPLRDFLDLHCSVKHKYA